MAQITGNSGDDVLDGTIFRDTIDGLGGDDWIDGRDADDTLRGGTGDDEIVRRRRRGLRSKAGIRGG